MGIPTLELHPGSGLGPFSLGCPIGDALAKVEQQQSLFESTVIKYSEEDALLWDVVVAFPHLGFHLCFDPAHQRLYKLEVYDVTRVHLRYTNNIIGGPSLPATFARMYSVLGPTFPGAYNQDTATYTLSYPGLSLLFHIPPRYASCCMQCKELPLEFPDGTTPVVSRVILHLGQMSPPPHGPALLSGGGPISKGIQVPSLGPRQELVRLMPPLGLPGGGLYMEEVHVRMGESLCFSAGQQEICFGHSPQDVWSELGRPCSIVQREMGTMLIHRPTAVPQHQHLRHQQPNPLPQHQHQHGHGLPMDLPSNEMQPYAQGGTPSHSSGDFAWSYFNRGIDVVFDAQTSTVKKFVLHTNAPGHPDFNEYVKCNFIIFPRADARGDRLEDSLAAAKGARGEAVTADTKWDEVQRILGCGGRAAIQTSGSLHIAFGPTFVYGLEGATFEVMRNGHISTVTLFEANSS